MKTLIELIKKAKEQNCLYLAIDKDEDVWGFFEKPRVNDYGWVVKQIGNYLYLGNYNLTCDWKDSLIDLNTLTL